MAKTPAQRIKKHGSKAAVPAHRLPTVTNPTTSRSPQKAQGNSNLIVIAGVVASLFLFWYLHLLTLNQMTQLSGGLAMPDSLVGGFSTEYVGQLRAAMDDDARGQVSYVHKTAGTLFALMFGFSWLLLIGTNVARKALRRAMWAAPMLFVVIRLWANVAVDAALAPATPNASAVALASTLTVGGWMLLLLSLFAGGAAVFLGRRDARRRPKLPRPAGVPTGECKSAPPDRAAGEIGISGLMWLARALMAPTKVSNPTSELRRAPPLWVKGGRWHQGRGR